MVAGTLQNTLPQQAMEKAMDTQKQDDFVMDLLSFIADEQLHGMLSWRTDGEYAPITFCINTNDLFFWACADAERVNKQRLPVLKQAVADCKAIEPVCGSIHGCMLFACRINKMRPQGAAYPKERALWPLFDVCGPERETGFVNPHKPGHKQ